MVIITSSSPSCFAPSLSPHSLVPEGGPGNRKFARSVAVTGLRVGEVTNSLGEVITSDRCNLKLKRLQRLIVPDVNRAPAEDFDGCSNARNVFAVYAASVFTATVLIKNSLESFGFFSARFTQSHLSPRCSKINAQGECGPSKRSLAPFNYSHAVNFPLDPL